jgi:chromosome segregation ATPase
MSSEIALSHDRVASKFGPALHFSQLPTITPSTTPDLCHIRRPTATTMPGLLQQGHKRRSLAISDDDDENDTSDRSSTSGSSKRARHARDASDRPPRANGQRRHNDTSDPPGEEEFMPGTLVRVKLTNFVTYTAAEFHLGPSLNMIIGPNGTGKSTLVCAICLGLGWSSEHLGRAKEIGLFVKNGSEEAEIEIELAAAPGMATNPVVRRLIRRSDGKTIFWVNNKQSSKAAVLALCKQFSIQIDNLCQFLPQDRVVEFAKMSDVDRLRETQRAAAPKQMVEWHDQLKALRTEEKALETKQQAEKRHLEGLERQQNADREDVERFHQREGLVQKRNCLDKVKPIIELGLLKNEANEAKQNLILARRELDQINADVEPVRQAQHEVELYKSQIENVVKLRKNRLDMIKTQADKVFAKIDQDKQAIEVFKAEIAGEAKSKKDREKVITRTNFEIQGLERLQQHEPVEYDAESFEQRKAEISTQIRSVSNRSADCDAEYSSLKARGAVLNDQNRSAQAQRKSLSTQSGKQMGILRQISRDTAQAWEWFQA